jgi:hypothetical protein
MKNKISKKILSKLLKIKFLNINKYIDTRKIENKYIFNFSIKYK